eukprot:gene1329-375_t
MGKDFKLEHTHESVKGPILLMVLDGFGINDDPGSSLHDTVQLADKEVNQMYSNWVKHAEDEHLFCKLAAHGLAVGLPDDTDMGNSEVGHNALGSGQIVAQGAKLVNECLAGDKPAMFASENWTAIKKESEGHTLHLFGLLSDGGIHSNIKQLEIILKNCCKDGIKKVRLHVVTDGRDVAPDSHPKFVKQLQDCLDEQNKQGCDYQIASGGGRMYCLMDRYEADWNIVKRAWDVMVHGTIDKSIVPEISDKYTGRYKSMQDWSKTVVPAFPDKQDQFYPPFVVVDDNDKPIGKIEDGDVVVCFNYRGDRAIEISRAFTEDEDTFRGKDHKGAFDRGTVPKVDYYGMLIYDSDKHIPEKSLAPNPDIKNVLSQYLLANNIASFAVAETHKYGHMTYFWNGNRSGYVNEAMERYCEVCSQPATPEQLESRPEMECVGITDAVIKALNSGKGYKFLRLNFANGDMCGHTGLIAPTTKSLVVMFEQMKRLIDAITEQDGAVIVTADHGNCEEMVDKKGAVMTSHTKKPVPFWIVDKNAKYKVDPTGIDRPGLANVAATVCNMFGLEAPKEYQKSLIKFSDDSNGATGYCKTPPDSNTPENRAKPY